MNSSITLYSCETTTRNILLFLCNELQLKHVDYISCLKKANKCFDEKGEYKYFHFMSPANGTYTYNDIDIRIDDFIVNNENAIINCSDKEYQVVKKVILSSHKINTIVEFIESVSSRVADIINQNQIENDQKITVRSLEKYGIFKTDLIPKRFKDTVFFKKGQLEEITSKVLDFIKPDSYNEYLKHGIPYKLNILLHGKPGVGKTSIIHHLATLCNSVIYTLNINSDISESDFFEALRVTNQDKKNAFVVIEDIDCIFQPRKSNDCLRNNITMQGILNALDGFNNNEGGIIIMTTNYPEKLDSALTRSGRIDINFELTYLDRYQAERMYMSFFDNQQDFDKTWDLIQDHEVPPCLFHDFLFKNRKTIGGICDNLDTFIKCLQDKKHNSLYS